MDLDWGYWQSLRAGDRQLLALGIVGIVALLFWHFATPSQSWPSQPIGTLVTDGAVKRRPSRSLSWQWIEGEGTLFLKDTIFSPPGTTSTVLFDNGSQMELQPNTMVRFSEIQTHQIDVALLRGDVDIKKREGTPGIRIRAIEEKNIPAAPQPVSARTERLRRIVAQRLRRLPDLDAGSIRLSEPFPDPTALALRFGELERQVAALGNPTLGRLRAVTEAPGERSIATSLTLYKMKTVAPEKKAVVRLQTGCVRLLWTPIPVRKVSYYLEISRDKKFRYVRSYGTRTNEIALRLNDMTRDFYWRVRAVYGSQSVVTPLTWFEVVRPKGTESQAKAELKTLPTWEVCDQM